jgi:hypothetical protein
MGFPALTRWDAGMVVSIETAIRRRLPLDAAFRVIAVIYAMFVFAASAPSPLYVVYHLAASFLVAALAVAVMPETVAARGVWWRFLRPRVGVAAASRGVFAVVLSCLVAVWAATLGGCPSRSGQTRSRPRRAPSA